MNLKRVVPLVAVALLASDVAAQAIRRHQTVATVAELYTSNAADDDLYQTRGYTTEGVGGNLYRYDASSAAAVDYGFVLDGKGGNGTGTGTGRFIAVDQTEADVTKFDARPDVSTDSGPAIRRALAIGKPVRFPKGTYTVAFDPASAFDDGGTTRYTYALSIPANAVLHLDHGATIKLADGAQSWQRVVQIRNVSNVKIFGELKVDGNVANRGTPTNEHMHGVFIFDATNVYIDRIDSRNTRGDNVFIGGTNESTVSREIHIGSLKGVAAGRKNLVLHQFDEVFIGDCDLDNTGGGATLYSGTPDDTDKHCFDVEPDSFTGSNYHRAKIGSLTTAGTGFDMSAGTTAASADKCIIDIGSLHHTHTSSTVKAWIQYACTVNIGNAVFDGIAGVAGTFEIWYAARLNADHITIRGSTPLVGDQMMLLSQVSSNRPVVKITQLDLTNTIGMGFENRDGELWIGRYVPRTAGVVAWCRGISSTAGLFSETHIEAIDMDNVGAPSGAGYAFYVTKEGSNNAVVRVQHTSFRDNRSPDLNYIYQIGSGAATELVLGSIENQSAVANINWVGTDKFYRTSGGGSGPRAYVCTGTPLSMIAAPIGSTAQRTDGGANTSWYVKESATDATGWVAK